MKAWGLSISLLAVGIAGMFGCQSESSAPGSGAIRHWNMVDSLENGRILSTATASDIMPFADVMTNNDSYLVANRMGMKKKVTIANEQRSAIFAPSQTSIECTVHVPFNAVLDFGYGISPDAWSRAGDGCQFDVLVERAGHEQMLFSHYIDPKMRKQDKRWFNARVDLSAFSGRDIALRFVTRGTYPIRPPFSRNADTRYDYALWSNPFIASRDECHESVNVILISIDTLRADHLSCLGYQRPTTPNLDKLAADSVVFEQAITAAPWTLPSHASLFTGLMPSQHGVQNFYQGLSDEALTLAEVMRENSFLTLGVASFEYLFPDYGLAQGFDEYYFHCPQRADEVVDEALAMLDRHYDKRFFMFLHFFDPHDPYNPPEPYDTMFCPSGEKECLRKEYKSPVKAFLGRRRRPTETDIQGSIALYDGEIRFVDDELSSFFDRLKELGLWQNTMIVVTSDHGEEFWDHRSLSHGFRLFEEQIRVPLIVKLPHLQNAGLRVKHQVGLIDVAPTILSEVGLGGAIAGPGRSLFAEPNTALPDDRFYVSETAAHGVMRLCLRSSVLKYITPNIYNYKGLNYRSPELLYDLRNDPHETENLIAVEPELTKSLREKAYRKLFDLSSPGWRILFSTPLQSKFSGEIRTEGRFKDIYSLSCLDEVLDHDDHQIEFTKSLSTYESLLSFRVEPPDMPLTIELKIDDNSGCLDRVRAGCGRPESSPFTLNPADAAVDLDALIAITNGRGRQEGVLIFCVPGQPSQKSSRSVGSVKIDARRREALKTLGYVR
ncbi:MAG TPA: sulfatase [bacterium]|nr:sulfatase [bacterium]